MTRDELLDRGMAVAVHAAEAPDRLAITSPRGERTFAALNRRSNRLVRALRRRGVGPGAGVALVAPNRAEFAEVLDACLRGGLRLTALNWHLTAAEIGYIVEDCGADAVVGDTRFGPTLVPALARLPLDRARVRLAVGGSIDGFEDYDAAVAAEDSADIDDPEPGTTMLYTSGTTGRPKGVHRPLGLLPAMVRANLRNPRYRGDRHRHLCTGPLYHAAPLGISLMAPLAAGVGVVLMDGWEAAHCLALIQHLRITHTHLVPTMFHRLLALPADVRDRADVSSLRMVVHGAAPCPVEVKRAMIDWWGPVLVEYYSATEGGGTLIGSHEWLERPASVGRAQDGQLIDVRDEEGSPVAPGTVGTIWITSPADDRFEYHNDEAKTAGTYREDAFTVGDLGYLDADGYLFLTGRSAEVIISGGVNIYPAEVDAALLAHPAVADAACVGVPNQEWGEEVKAVVQLAAGVAPSPELASELVAWCRERLARHTCPRSVDFVAELPRFETGKIYRRTLRDRYWPAPGEKAQAEGAFDR